MRYAEKLIVMCDFGDALKSLGTDPRIKVGAVVFPVDCSAVWGIGYNGAAAGLSHDSVASERGQMGSGVSGAAHAEANALLKAGDRVKYLPSLLYCSLMPCPYCAPLIANSLGICGVIVGESRDDVKSGRHVLEAAGIPIISRNDVELARTGKSDPGPTAVVQWWRSLRATRFVAPWMLGLDQEGAER